MKKYNFMSSEADANRIFMETMKIRMQKDIHNFYENELPIIENKLKIETNPFKRMGLKAKKYKYYSEKEIEQLEYSVVDFIRDVDNNNNIPKFLYSKRKILLYLSNNNEHLKFRTHYNEYTEYLEVMFVDENNIINTMTVSGDYINDVYICKKEWDNDLFNSIFEISCASEPYDITFNLHKFLSEINYAELKERYLNFLNDILNQNEEILMEDSLQFNSNFSEFNNYQQMTKQFAIYPKEKALEYLHIGLAGEVGELLNKFKKTIRDGKQASLLDITLELGDVMWYISQLCNEYNLELQDVCLNNINKLSKRQEKNLIKGNGDFR